MLMQEEVEILEGGPDDPPQVKPKFNPKAKYTSVQEDKPKFDPNKPFEKKNLSDNGGQVGESETPSTENKTVIQESPHKIKTVFDEIRERDDKTFGSRMNNKAVSDITYMQKPISEENIQKKENQNRLHRKDIERAIDNTALRALKQRGIPAQKGSVLYNLEKQKVQQAYDKGDAKFHKYIDKKTGEEVAALDRTIGWYDGLTKGWNEAIHSNEESDAFVKMTNAERVEFLKEKQLQATPSDGYMGEQLGNAGSIGNLIGFAGPTTGKAITGAAIGAGLAAAAPETGGVSLAGLPTVLAYAWTAPDMIKNGMMNETIRRYQELKNQHPEIPDEQAMAMASEGGMAAGGIVGAAKNAVLMGEGLKLPFSSESKSVIGGALKRSTNAAVKFGVISGSGTAAEQIEGNIEGIKTKPTEILNNSINSAIDNAGYGFALHALMSEVPQIPKMVKSAFKYSIVKDGKLPEVQQVLENAEAEGKIPEGKTAEVVSDLQNYKMALDKTSDGLTPESKAAVAGLIQKKGNLLEEMKTKDDSQHENYKKQVEAIDEQIKEISRTNKPYQSEIDEATGQPLEKPSFDDVAKKRVDDLADKISKGKEIEDIVDVKTEQNFPEELEKALNRISKEEKSKNKDSEKPNTELSDNIENYLSKKEPKGNTAPNPLADVESTESALKSFKEATKNKDEDWGDKYRKITNLIPDYDKIFDSTDYLSHELIAKKYHEAKKSGDNPELVKAVEDAIGNKEIKNEEAKPIEENEIPITETKASNTNVEPDKVIPETKEAETEPPKPPVEELSVVGDGEEPLRGIKHAAMAETREKIGIPEYEGKAVEGHEQLLTEAKETISKNPNVANEVLERFEKGDRVTNKDNAIMAIYKSALDAELEANPSKELFQKITRLANALDPAGTEAGKLLESRKLFSQGDNLADFLLDKQDSQGFPLTEKQIESKTNQYKEIKKAKDDLAAEVQKETENDAKLIAEHGFNKAKALKRKAAKKTHEEYVQERKQAVADAREALKQLRTGGFQATIPGIRELQAIAPHIKKAMQSLLDEGIDKFDNVVSALHADFKDVLEGISKSHIMEVISGKHDEVKQTKPQKNAELRLLKREAELLNILQKERLGEAKVKNEKVKAEKSRRIVELEKKIVEVRKINKNRIEEEPVEDKTAADPEYNKRLQTKLTKRIEELQGDLKNKTYAEEKPTPKPFVLSRKTQMLKDRVIQLEKKVAEERFLAQRSKLSKWEKGWDAFQNILGIRRVIQTSVDASIWLRQLWGIAFNPRKWGIAKKFVLAGVNSVFSQTKYDRYMDAIHKSPDFKHTLEDGIRYNELNAIHPSQQNEFFPKSFIHAIPIAKEIITSSQRIADASLNVARYELYQKYKKVLLSKGITRESDPVEYKEMAKWVMNTTGSGNLLSMFENRKAEKVLGTIFYGARLMAANFNSLNPLYYAKMPKAVRIEAMKDLASTTTTVLATGLALAAAGGKISLNPDDSDFLQLRFGNKVYDISGGKASYIRTFLRWVEAGWARATKSKYEANKAMEFAAKSTLNFWRYKASPNTGYIINAVTGKDALGKDFDWKDIYEESIPLYVDDSYHAIKDEGMTGVVTVLLPNLLGIGYGSYYSEPSQKPLEETLERNLNSDELDKSTIQNYKDGGRDITDKEFSEFVKERDSFIEKEIKKLYEGTSAENLLLDENKKVVTKKYSEMSREEIIKATSSIKRKATEEAKNKLFGEKGKEDSRTKRGKDKLQKAKEKIGKLK